MGGRMELPDFDTLKRLAVIEPERLEELLHQQVEELLEQVDPERQRCLRGLQFRIDCQRRLAKNHLDSCIRITNMMHDSFYDMRSKINNIDHELASASGTSAMSNNVILISDYRASK